MLLTFQTVPCGRCSSTRASSRTTRCRTNASLRRDGGSEAHLGEGKGSRVALELSRRSVLLTSIPLALALPASAADVLSVGDVDKKFALSIPSDWEGGVGEVLGGAGTRIVYAWHEPRKTSTSVSVISTVSSVEYSTLGSFGTAYGFALTNVTRLDRRARKKDKQIADLVDSSEKGGAYVYEYTLQRPEEALFRHVYEKVSLKFDGVYNRLWTVTGVWLDADSEADAADVRAAVDSFQLA